MSHKMAWGVSFEYYLLFFFLEMPGLKSRIRRIPPTWVVVFLIKKKDLQSVYLEKSGFLRNNKSRINMPLKARAALHNSNAEVFFKYSFERQTSLSKGLKGQKYRKATYSRSSRENTNQSVIQKVAIKETFSVLRRRSKCQRYPAKTSQTNDPLFLASSSSFARR